MFRFRSFRVLELLGEGTFGQVVKCEDCETKVQVAVKVIKNKPAYHNQALMEIRILKTVMLYYGVL
jgi:dual specificity protein kinase YAK1